MSVENKQYFASQQLNGAPIWIDESKHDTWVHFHLKDYLYDKHEALYIHWKKSTDYLLLYINILTPNMKMEVRASFWSPL